MTTVPSRVSDHHFRARGRLVCPVSI